MFLKTHWAVGQVVAIKEQEEEKVYTFFTLPAV
jgi:hypothetical protein